MDLIMTQPTNELEQTLQKIAKLNSMYWKHLGKKHTNCPTCGVDPNILLDWLLAHDKEIDRQARIDETNHICKQLGIYPSRKELNRFITNYNIKNK